MQYDRRAEARHPAWSRIENHSLMSLDQIARWIERDIEDRRLTTGDSYLTAETVGRILGVSRATADRAMKSLSTRHVLMRRQRSGTFVGPRAVLADGRQPGLKAVHVVAGASALTSDRELVLGLIERLPALLPNVVVTLHLSPSASFEDDALKVIDGIGAGRDTRQALILVRPTAAVRRAAHDSGLATIAVDHEFKDDLALPTVAYDDSAVGASVATIAAAHQADTLLLISDSSFRAGDERLAEGIARTACGAALRVHRLLVPESDSDVTAIRAAFGNLTLPAVVLARTSTTAKAAVAERSRLGIRSGALTVLTLGETPVEGALEVRRDPGVPQTIEWITKTLCERSPETDRVLRIGASFPRPECSAAESVLANV